MRPATWSSAASTRLSASGLGNGCPPDAPVEPCGPRAIAYHGTAVASALAGRRTGTAPDASHYSIVVLPTVPGTPEVWMWHVALNEIIRHAWDAETPSFETAIVTISVPATPLPDDPLYVALADKVKRMTRGVDVNGNEDANGKKFLFTVAAGNVNPRADFCHTFPAVLGPETDGVVTVGGITRENVWWSGSCAGEVVEVVAPAESPVLASHTDVSRYRSGVRTSGTSFAAPYVVGIAARLLEIDPTRTPAELEALLKASPSRSADSGLPVPVLTIGMEMRNVRSLTKRPRGASPEVSRTCGRCCRRDHRPGTTRSLPQYNEVRRHAMPTSTITSKGQTTVPKEVRDALDLAPGDRLSWEIRGGKVAITTERPGLFRWEGIFKDGPGDAVEAVKEARKRRGRI